LLDCLACWAVPFFVGASVVASAYFHKRQLRIWSQNRVFFHTRQLITEDRSNIHVVYVPYTVAYLNILCHLVLPPIHNKYRDFSLHLPNLRTVHKIEYSETALGLKANCFQRSFLRTRRFRFFLPYLFWKRISPFHITTLKFAWPLSNLTMFAWPLSNLMVNVFRNF
jgi:hypothetical protein